MPKYHKKSSFQLLKHFICIYPLRFFIVLCALILAGFVETIGVGALLPLLNLVLDINESDASSTLNKVIGAFFNTINVEQTFENLLVVIVIAILLKALIIFQALKIVSYIAVDITYDLRQQFIKSLISAKWSYYSSLNVGHSANAIATEADYAGQFCVIMGKTISSAIQAGVYTAIAFSIDWRISLAAFVMGCVAAFILKFLVRMSRDAGNSMAKVLNQLLSRLNEALSGAKPIKAMGEEDRYIDILSKDTLELQSSRKRLALSSLLMNLIHEPLLVFLMAVGLFWAYSFADYPMSELFMMAFLFNRLLSQINMVQNHYQKTAIFEGAVNAILEKTLSAQDQLENMNGNIVPQLQKEIKLHNISVSYGKNKVVQSLTEEIPANKMTVIFGASGSGKSSLLDVTLGLLANDSGEIFIDETPLKDINIKAWRKMIGYVPQETFLFHDTIAKNVTLGDDSISSCEITKALKTADAWEFVKELDDGLEHVVGERGGKLSGGQRQRLALARALVRRPSLLILDEATSGLDKKSERTILEALKNMLPDITIILISHDPEILDIADNIIRLEKKL